jgi:hypothetical protein
MSSCRILRRKVLVRTDVSEERIAYITTEAGSGELGTTLSVTSSMLRLLVTAYIVPSSSIFVTLLMEAIHSSETSVLTIDTRHHIPEDGILHRHRSENLNSYIALTGWAL